MNKHAPGHRPPMTNPSPQPKRIKRGRGLSTLAKFLRFPPLIPLSGAAAFGAREFFYRERDQAGKLSYRDHETFDPKGPGSGVNALLHPEHYSTANRIQEEVLARTKEVYKGRNISNGEANAFLHAYLSYRLTKALGPTIARRFTDANEVKPPRLYTDLLRSYSPTTNITREEAKAALDGFKNPQEDMMADLSNNGFGRRLYVEGRAKNVQEAEDIIIKALKNGDLMVINKH